MSRIIYFSTLLYAFIIPLSRAGIVGLSALLILLSIFEGNWRDKWNRLKDCKIFLAFALFIIYNLISLIWTEEIYEGVKYIAKYWYFLPIFVIFLSFPREKSYHILIAFLSGMLVSEIISYGIFFQLWETRHGTPDDPSPFMNHLDYSIYLAITSMVVFIKILHSDNLRDKIITSLFFITVTSNLFITGGRAGQLAFLVTLFIIVVIYFNRSILQSILIGVTIITTILILPMILSDTFQNRIERGKKDITELLDNRNFDTSLGMRIGAWEVAGVILRDNYLIGTGNEDNIKQLKVITIEREYLQPLHWYGHFHNQHLQTFTALGIVGLLLLYNIFFQIYKLPLNRENRFIAISFSSIFIIGFFAEPFLHKQFTMALFTLFIGYLILNRQSESSNN